MVNSCTCRRTFANAIIYKICSEMANLTYYGSTTQTLSKRFCGHNAANNKCMSKLIMGYSDVKIELVEKFSCGSRKELRAREAHYIKNNPCVNVQIPNRTLAEYRLDNLVQYKAYQKIYQTRYRESVKSKVYQKNYQIAWRLRNKNYHKKWRANKKAQD